MDVHAVAGLPGRIRRKWLSESRIDVPLVGFMIGVHIVLTVTVGIPSLLEGVPVGSRPGLYGAAAIVVSLTGTLASVTVAQYLSGRGERMAYLKSLHPKELARTWKGIFLGSVFSVFLFLSAYAVDLRAGGPHIGTWLFEAGALLALLRFVRLASLFGKLVELIVMDDTDPLAKASFDLSPEFFTGTPAGSQR